MRKIIPLLLIAFMLCTGAIAKEQENPLYLWVPYNSEKPDDLNNFDNKYIFIQDADLEQIKNSTSPKKTDPGKPPVSYQITSVDYSAEIINNVIKIKSVYKINKLDDEWAQVPLILDNVNISSAILGDKPASVAVKDNYHALTLKQKGSYVLTLNFAEKLNNLSSNSRSFSFVQPVIPITNLECLINEQDIEFEIPNAVSVITKNTKLQSKTIASLLPVSNIQIKWTPKSTLISNIKPDNNLPASVNAVTYSKIEAGRGALKGTFNADFDIRRSPLSHFEFYIPEGVEIDSIYANDNELVDPYPEIKDNILSVDLISAVEGKTRLTLYFRQNFEDSSFKTKLPAITLVNDNIDRETGYVALVETTNIESSITSADEKKNYREIDSNELEGDLRGLKSSIALKYTKNKDNIKEIPYDITVNIVRHKDVAVYEANIDYTNITSVINKDGEMFTKATIQVKNTGKQFLDITLPKNSSLWSVYVNGKSVKPALKDDKKGIYAIPLVKSASFPVEVVYFTDNAITPLLTKINALKTELASNSVKWIVYAPEGKDFVSMSAFSNLLKEKKPSGKIPIPFVMGDQIKSTVTSVSEKLETANQRMQAPMPSSEARKDWGMGQQQIYKSKKVGKLPVYVNLPLIGESQSFYQLSFEAGISPSICALYLNDSLFVILKLMILAMFVYTAFKHPKIRPLWLTPTVNLFNLIKNKVSSISKSVKITVLSIIGGVIIVISGFIFLPYVMFPLVFLGVALLVIVLVVTGIVLLIRFLLKKWRTKNNENE